MTKTKRKATKLAKADDVRKWLRENDIFLYISNETIPQACRRMEQETGLKPASGSVSELKDYECQYWKTCRRKPVHPTGLLTSEQWDELKQCVELIKPIVIEHRLNMKQCIMLLRAHTSTACVKSLCGLPRRLRVWEDS